MSRQAKVTVVIPCFNHGEFLPEAVASVLNAKRDDVDLIVVDDGSTDARTQREMDALRERGIRVIRQENKGVAAARNAGIAASSAEYILPLDADNRLRPAYFEHGIRILGAHPSVGVVYGNPEYVGGSAQWQSGPFDAGQLMRWNYIDACAIYRRKIWDQTGGYDGMMPVPGFEDWDLWLGALERGWQFVYVPEVLFDYRVSETSMIAHARRALPDVEKFVCVKHSDLYRREWDRLEQEHRSIKGTSRNLSRLLGLRLKQRLAPNRRNGHTQP